MSLLIDLPRLSLLRPVAGDSTTESRATECIEAASEWFEGQAGAVAVADYTVRLSGNGTQVLKVPYQPIVSVSSLTVDGVTWTVLDTGTDTYQYAFIDESRRFLRARYSTWTQGVGNILLSYRAGYTTIPADIQQAVAMIAWLLIEETNRLGITAKSLGPEQVNMVARNDKDYEYIMEVVSKYARPW